MVTDKLYKYGDYLFYKKTFSNNSKKRSVSSHRDEFLGYNELHRDINLELYGQNWRHGHSTFFILHPKDPKKYIEMTEHGKKRDFFGKVLSHFWYTDCLTSEHYDVIEENDEKRFTVLLCGKYKFNWNTSDGRDRIFCIFFIFSLLLWIIGITFR